MNKSLFVEIAQKYYPQIRQYIELVNGKRGTQTYLHEEMLRREFSPTQDWTSASVNASYVAADVVDMDSPLPLKRRDSIAVVSGTLPTIGMKLWLNAKQINDINIMTARGQMSGEVAVKVLDDSVRCVNGIRERLEACFLQGLSEGVCLVPDADNAGVGVRLSFGYLESNAYKSTAPWGQEGATPLSDIARVLGANPSIDTIMLAKETYDLLRQSDEARALVAGYRGTVAVSDPKAYPVPPTTAFNEAMASEYGVTLKVVNRSVLVEKNGKRQAIRPWNRDKVIFLVGTQVGALVYGSHPEETHKVAGVEYSKPLPYALLSKYAQNDPLREFTAIQGIVAPIIENVDQIYSLDVTGGQVLDKEAEQSDTDDSKTTIFGSAYAKTLIIEKYKAVTGLRIANNIGDQALIAKVNELSLEAQNELKAQLEAGA